MMENQASCPWCHVKFDLKNRAVSEVCGHVYCRQCFVKNYMKYVEECGQCVESSRNVQETSEPDFPDDDAGLDLPPTLSAFYDIPDVNEHSELFEDLLPPRLSEERHLPPFGNSSRCNDDRPLDDQQPVIRQSSRGRGRGRTRGRGRRRGGKKGVVVYRRRLSINKYMIDDPQTVEPVQNDTTRQPLIPPLVPVAQVAPSVGSNEHPPLKLRIQLTDIKKNAKFAKFLKPDGNLQPMIPVTSDLIESAAFKKIDNERSCLYDVIDNQLDQFIPSVSTTLQYNASTPSSENFTVQPQVHEVEPQQLCWDQVEKQSVTSPASTGTSVLNSQADMLGQSSNAFGINQPLKPLTPPLVPVAQVDPSVGSNEHPPLKLRIQLTDIRKNAKFTKFLKPDGNLQPIIPVTPDLVESTAFKKNDSERTCLYDVIDKHLDQFMPTVSTTLQYNVSTPSSENFTVQPQVHEVEPKQLSRDQDEKQSVTSSASTGTSVVNSEADMLGQSSNAFGVGPSIQLPPLNLPFRYHPANETTTATQSESSLISSIQPAQVQPEYTQTPATQSPEKNSFCTVSTQTDVGEEIIEKSSLLAQRTRRKSSYVHWRKGFGGLYKVVGEPESSAASTSAAAKPSVIKVAKKKRIVATKAPASSSSEAPENSPNKVRVEIQPPLEIAQPGRLVTRRMSRELAIGMDHSAVQRQGPMTLAKLTEEISTTSPLKVTTKTLTDIQKSSTSSGNFTTYVHPVAAEDEYIMDSEDVENNVAATSEKSSSSSFTVPKKKRKRLSIVVPDHITITGDVPSIYRCDVCMKKFKTRAHIKYHEFCQNKEKPFKCDQCGQGFIAKSHFEYHLRTHTGERPYICPKCGKGFNQRGKVTRHMRSHTGEKPFICAQCGRGFANAQALRSHHLIHTGERPYACQYCNKRFTGMTNLKKHVITHTGERPFQCNHCGKSFGLKWTLDLHLRTHSTERPHACEICSRAFSNSKDLRRHAIIHSDERPFNCLICGTTFRRKDNLDRHITNNHKQPKEVARQLANQAASAYIAKQKDERLAALVNSKKSRALNILRKPLNNRKTSSNFYSKNHPSTDREAMASDTHEVSGDIHDGPIEPASPKVSRNSDHSEDSSFSSELRIVSVTSEQQPCTSAQAKAADEAALLAVAQRQNAESFVCESATPDTLNLSDNQSGLPISIDPPPNSGPALNIVPKDKFYININGQRVLVAVEEESEGEEEESSTLRKGQPDSGPVNRRSTTTFVENQSVSTNQIPSVTHSETPALIPIASVHPTSTRLDSDSLGRYEKSTTVSAIHPMSAQTGQIRQMLKGQRIGLPHSPRKVVSDDHSYATTNDAPRALYDKGALPQVERNSVEYQRNSAPEHLTPRSESGCFTQPFGSPFTVHSSAPPSTRNEVKLPAGTAAPVQIARVISTHPSAALLTRNEVTTGAAPVPTARIISIHSYAAPCTRNEVTARAASEQKARVIGTVPMNCGTTNRAGIQHHMDNVRFPTSLDYSPARSLGPANAQQAPRPATVQAVFPGGANLLTAEQQPVSAINSSKTEHIVEASIPTEAILAGGSVIFPNTTERYATIPHHQQTGIEVSNNIRQSKDPAAWQPGQQYGEVQRTTEVKFIQGTDGKIYRLPAGVPERRIAQVSSFRLSSPVIAQAMSVTCGPSNRSLRAISVSYENGLTVLRIPDQTPQLTRQHDNLEPAPSNFTRDTVIQKPITKSTMDMNHPNSQVDFKPFPPEETPIVVPDIRSEASPALSASACTPQASSGYGSSQDEIDFERGLVIDTSNFADGADDCDGGGHTFDALMNE